MKQKALETQCLASYIGALALGAVLLSATVTRCQAGSGDPSGGNSNTWDCVFQGNIEKGVSSITFFSDFTFSGVEVIAPNGSAFNNGQLTTGRDSSGIGRTGTGTSGFTNEFLWGFQPFAGNWTTNINGNIIGSFERVVGTGTEAVSFVGKATYGKTARLTLLASTPEGKMSYRGVLTPPAIIPELAGNWYGYATTVGSGTVLEQFTLSDSGIPGLFDVTGNGPDYSLIGECVVSSQKRIGFAALLTPDLTTSNILRATVGPYSKTSKAITATTTGAVDPGVQAKFRAVLAQ